MSPPFVLHDQEALLTRLLLNHQEGKRTVFLVGSPLTAPWKDGGPGVPGVAAMVERARRALQQVGKDVKSQDYQTVFQALQGSHGIGRINALVREAVLKACTLDGDLRERALAGDHEACEQLEKDVDAWALSPGVEALGRLVASAPNIFGRELLTSNFDPLLSVSIRKAGGRAWETRLHGDGHLDASRSDGCRVIQVHGAWHGADTLHSPIQLQAERPALQDSLRRRFEHATLVVVAYGGWKDVFTRTLFELVKWGAAFPEILWAFYSSDDGAIRSTHADLLEGLRPGIERGRVDCYGGIDSNRFFPALAERLQSETPSALSNPKAATADYRPESPFIVGPPIESDDDFYGRRSQREEIRAAVFRRQPVQILGERRMGKTSLLRWVRRHVAEWPQVGKWPVACVSAQGPARRSPADFVQAVGFALGRGAEVGGWLSTCSTAQAERALQELLPLVVLVDEADELSAPGNPFEDGFLETLRAFGQDGRLVWLSTSLTDLHKAFHSSGRTSSFLNDSAQVWAGRLEDEEARELLARGGYPPEVVGALFEEAGGLPYAQQCVADAYFRTGRLDKAVDALEMALEPVFATWWRHRSEEDRSLLRRAVPEVAIANLDRRDRLAARGLVRLGLLKEAEESFRAPGAAWRRYVGEH